ncbi:MAG: hypothetical protein ACI4EJ_05210 [Bacteroides sp.]
MIEDNRSKRKYRKKISRFWKFLGIYSAILVALIVIGIIWVYGLLGDYEKGMPDVAIGDVIKKQFSADNIEQLVMDNADGISAYEKMDYVVSYMKNAVAENEVTFARKSGEYTTDTPVYVIKSGDKNIAKVSLKSEGKNGHGFPEWGVDKVTFGEFLDKDNSIIITAPSKAVVTINGKQAGDDIVNEKDVAVEKAKNVGDYVAVPTNTIYKIEGLMAEPEILATLDGTQLNVAVDEQNKGGYVISYPTDEELLKAQSDNIKNINVEYGKYIINKGSLTRLKSYMTGNAKQYVSDIPAVWAFLWGKTYTYEFKTNDISNFVKYSDDCFSCDVHFDLYVDWGKGNKTYDTNLSYVFVKQNGKWYLADFAINY